MNKTIDKADLERMQRCIVEMNNKQNCYETTGIHFSTVERILERGWAKEGQLEKLMSYCDEVEGLTTVNTKD